MRLLNFQSTQIGEDFYHAWIYCSIRPALDLIGLPISTANVSRCDSKIGIYPLASEARKAAQKEAQKRGDGWHWRVEQRELRDIRSLFNHSEMWSDVKYRWQASLFHQQQKEKKWKIKQ